MNTEIKNLLTIYENQMASFWQLDGQLHECQDDDRAIKLEKRQKITESCLNKARDDLIAA